jgi:hypothetical protein
LAVRAWITIKEANYTVATQVSSSICTRYLAKQHDNSIDHRTMFDQLESGTIEIVEGEADELGLAQDFIAVTSTP